MCGYLKWDTKQTFMALAPRQTGHYKKMALTAKKMIKAIEESKGYISGAASLCGVARSTFYNNLEKYPAAKEALENVKQSRHEYVESKLMKQIDKDNLTAIIFYLKTQCGWAETSRTEITGADGGNIRIVQIGGINANEDI